MVKKTAKIDDLVRSELMAIKRLMVLHLLRDGATQSEIAAALGVSQSNISKMFPNGIQGATRPGRSAGK